MRAEHHDSTRGRARETPALQPRGVLSGSVDRAGLFLNILQLFFISLLPFTTAVVGRYSDQAAAVILYGLHLEALGLAQYAHWAYLLRNPHLTRAPIDAATARAVTVRILAGPVAWVLAIVLAFSAHRSDTPCTSLF